VTLPALYVPPGLPVHVPDEMWYRFEDRRYSIADEYGDHYETRMEVELLKLYALRHTPKGVWLGLFRNYDSSTPIALRAFRFVLKSATRKFACPTIELAKESFIARKRKQASIHRARAAQADRAIEIVERKWS
jgi:hypothetical protein